MYSRSFPFTLTAVKLEQLGVLEISNVCTYFWLRSKSSLSIYILEICLVHSPQSWWHSWECAWLRCRRSQANTLNKLPFSFFFRRGAIHQLNNEHLNSASYPQSNLASTVGSALGLGAGDLKRACLANSFFFFFVGEAFIILIMNTWILPHTLTAVWLTHLIVCWASVPEDVGSNHRKDK